MSLDEVVRILIWAIEPTVPIRFQPFGAIRLKPFQTVRRIVPRDRDKKLTGVPNVAYASLGPLYTG